MHIVIADSSQTVLDILEKQVLSSGNSVSTISDGMEALEYINSDAPMDVLLTGLELPNVSGLELCWAADTRDRSSNPSYVIVMSSSSDVEKLIEALDSGADDFLRKPFVKDELLARLRAAERVLRAQFELVRLASVDPLTNVSNRRSFFDNVEKIIGSAKKPEHSAIIKLDIDHLKKINDDLGHHAGDAVLIQVCKALRKDGLVFGRLGGEEFAAFLVDANSDAAYEYAEKMRKVVEGLKVTVQGIPVSVTSSFGVSEYLDDDNTDSLLKRADQALYAAKNGGRNNTVIWGSAKHHASMEDSIYS